MLLGTILLSMQAPGWLGRSQSLDLPERAHHEYACINAGIATYYKVLYNITGSRGATKGH